MVLPATRTSKLMPSASVNMEMEEGEWRVVNCGRRKSKTAGFQSPEASYANTASEIQKKNRPS